MRLIDRPEEYILPHHQFEPRNYLHFTNWPEAELFKIKMRELQATQSIFAKALLQANVPNPNRIKVVHLAIGEIAELDQDAIQRYWNEIRQGTVLEQAQLHFRSIPARVQCMACFREYDPVAGKIHCPYCGSYGAKVLRGEEFYLESMEWDDE